MILRIFLILLFLFPSVAQAAEKNKSEEHAQKIINSCWATSEENRKGSTAKIREGTLKSALCMKEHIIFLSETILFKDDKKIQKEVENALENIKFGTGRLYWHLNNSHEYCGSSPCGTMYTIFHNNEVAHAMEDILRDFYQKIEEYNRHYQSIDSISKLYKQTNKKN